MIDGMKYPHGDLQTWDRKLADEPVKHEESESITSQSEGTVFAFLSDQGVREALADYGMAIGGLLDEDALDRRRSSRQGIRIRDRVSGLVYYPGAVLTPSVETAESVELFRAAVIRSHVAARVGQETSESGQHALGGPISDFRIGDKNDLTTVLELVKNLIQEAFPSERVKIWLRGQRAEYEAPNRSENVLSYLHLGPTGNRFPSLLPSLGRFALANPDAVDLGFSHSGPSHHWKKPFLIWLARNNERWLSGNPGFEARLDSALVDPDDGVFAKLLADTPFDPGIPDEFDDARQWFFSRFKYSSWIWVLQQYGYMASMLDITDDVEQALFFSEARIVDGKFVLDRPQEDRLIYVFAETGPSSSFFDTSRVDWGAEDWSRRLPPRITAQKAACLVGSSWDRQNYYGHLVIARVRFNDVNCRSALGVQDMFPPPERDLLLKTLIDARPRPAGLYY